MKVGGPTLSGLVIRRIVLFSALAMAAQFAGVVMEYSLDKPKLAQHAIEREAELLQKGISVEGGKPAYTLPTGLADRYGELGSGYCARVRTPTGAPLFSSPDETACKARFAGLGDHTPEFWVSWIDASKRLSVGGGRRFSEGAVPVVIELAIIDDSKGVLLAVLAHEVMDHMVLPMSLVVIVVLGAASLSINRALRPVEEAAEMAAHLNPASTHSRLPIAGMPIEIAKFTQAVNASFEAVRDLVNAQKVFTSAISHEVRTPLAVARLELEKIADPRARKVEADLDELNRLVEQLTSLARLEGAGMLPTETVEPLMLAEKVVAALAPVVYDAGKSIELVDERPVAFSGHPALVENALRNLIENAIRHSDSGAAISVVVGPGAVISVLDRNELKDENARGRPKEAKAQGVGLGLAIVRRIASLESGQFEFQQEPEGSMARLRFCSNSA